MGFLLNLKDLRIQIAKDGDTYSDGELYYQLLINDRIVSSNTECIIVPDGVMRYLGDVTVQVPELAFKAELRIDELDATKDDSARSFSVIDMNAADASSQHAIRAFGAQGRLDCTISFEVDVAESKVTRQ
jgi:hypothetical protein